MNAVNAIDSLEGAPAGKIRDSHYLLFFFFNLEINVQQVNLLLRRTGGLGPPIYSMTNECETDSVAGLYR